MGLKEIGSHTTLHIKKEGTSKQLTFPVNVCKVGHKKHRITKAVWKNDINRLKEHLIILVHDRFWA